MDWKNGLLVFDQHTQGQDVFFFFFKGCYIGIKGVPKKCAGRHLDTYSNLKDFTKHHLG